MVQAKAFDKKTSVLLYLVKIIKQNDDSLLSFKDDLSSVAAAERIMIDGLSGDLKQLKQDLANVKEASTKDGDTKREVKGRADDRKLTLAELSEQRSHTRTVSGVTHYNRMECENDLTPMERFAHNAELALNEALLRESKMKERYSNILKYFGEDESMNSTDFFGIIAKFITEFDAAHEELKRMDDAKVS